MHLCSDKFAFTSAARRFFGLGGGLVEVRGTQK